MDDQINLEPVEPPEWVYEWLGDIDGIGIYAESDNPELEPIVIID